MPSVVARALCSTAIGAAIAAAALGLGWTPGHETASARSLAAVRPPSGPANRQRLSPSDRRSLVAWARRLVRCLDDRGLAVGHPVAGADAIQLRVKGGGKPIAAMVRCAASLGDPPPGASVVLQRGGRTISIFKPKTCPLGSQERR